MAAETSRLNLFIMLVKCWRHTATSIAHSPSGRISYRPPATGTILALSPKVAFPP